MIRSIISSLIAVAALVAPAAAEPARFSVAVSGEGPDIILVPGLASSAAVWDATVEQLSSTHRVHVVQVGGFAGAPAGGNAEGAVLAPLVVELGDYAATLNSPAIIGHSMGGLAALEVAAARPDIIARIMVVDALPFYPLIFNQAITVETITPQAAMMRDQMTAMSAEAYAASQSASLAIMAKTAEALEQVKQWSAASDQSVAARAMYDVMTTDARSRLADVKVPVMIAYAYDPAMGRTGAFITAMYVNAYAGLPKGELKRIDGGYHFIMLDQPEAFSEAVMEFLAE